MIDITEKSIVARSATAQGKIHLQKKTIEAIQEKTILKGDVLETAKLSALQAVKNTPQSLVYCHNIPIESVKTIFDIGEEEILVKVTVKTSAKTGVEMESLQGVQTALATIWDMTKYLEKDEIGNYPSTKISDIIVSEKKKGDA